MTSSCTDYDTEFQALQNQKYLNWKPWVGENYKILTGKKLLIVGESHYNEITQDLNPDPAEQKGLTRIMIHGNGLCGHGKTKDNKDKPPHRFIRNIEKAMFNKSSINSTNGKTLWRAVSFYNFVQRPMVSLKHRPDKNDWKNGWETFFKVIGILQPDYILFCGVSAFQKNFLDEEIKRSCYSYDKKIRKKEEKIKGTSLRTKGIISIQTHQSIVTCIRHPSMSFSPKEWHKVINNHMPEYVSWLKSQS